MFRFPFLKMFVCLHVCVSAYVCAGVYVCVPRACRSSWKSEERVGLPKTAIQVVMGHHVDAETKQNLDPPQDRKHAFFHVDWHGYVLLALKELLPSSFFLTLIFVWLIETKDQTPKLNPHRSASKTWNLSPSLSYTCLEPNSYLPGVRQEISSKRD